MTRPGAYDMAAFDEAYAALGRFRAAWSWLGEALHPAAPGPRPARPVRPVDEPTAAARAARYRYERAAHLDQIRRGNKGTAARAAPAHLGAVEARARITADVAELASRCWTYAHGDGLVLTVAEMPSTSPCPWCHGAGHALRPDDWPAPAPYGAGTVGEWPSAPIPCSLCRGRTVVPGPHRCQACGAPAGRCPCDRADVVVALSLSAVTGLVDLLTSEALADIAETLDDCARHAEGVAGAGRDLRRLPGNPPPECPVCGSRELHAEVSSPDPREWSIRCAGPDCRCHGKDCPCTIGTDRRKDRRHVWPARVWDGPDNLAALLGVATPAAVQSWADYLDRLHDTAYAEHLGRLWSAGDTAGVRATVAQLAARDDDAGHAARTAAAALRTDREGKPDEQRTAGPIPA
jgi:hypothetical protein